MIFKALISAILGKLSSSTPLARASHKFVEEVGNLLEFCVFIAISIAAHSIVKGLEGSDLGLLQDVFKIVEKAALFIGAAEYLVKLAFRAFRNVRNDA